MPTDSVRFGVYFSISAVMFGYLAAIAIWRMVYKPSRGRLAIASFAVSWMALCVQAAVSRFGGEIFLAHGWSAEIVRIACAVSLAWLVAEYGRGNLIAHDHAGKGDE